MNLPSSYTLWLSFAAMTRTILAVLVGVALNVAVFTEPTYPIYGQGSSSCGAWINAAPNDFAFRAWVNGFVTAAAIHPMPSMRPC